MDDFPNLRHVQIVCQALRNGSVSRAAQILNITQPAASQGIANLERTIGTPLIVRQSSGIAPTQAGEIFALRAERAIEVLREGARQAQKSAGVHRRGRPELSGRFTAAQLRALVAVGNLGSFTVAANDLKISQPTVHRAARDFEACCEFEVFQTTRGRVELSTAGAILLQAAKLARSELRSAGEEIGALRGGGKSTFVLGSLPLARSLIVPKAIHESLSQDSGLQVRVIEGRYDELLRGLREGDLDCLIGALRQPAPANDVTEETLFEDELAVVCRPDHPLVGQKDLTFEDTGGYPWIGPPITTPAGGYLARRFGADGKIPSPVKVVTSSLVLVKNLIHRGPYLTLISRHQIQREVQSDEFAVLPIRLDNRNRAIGLTYRRSWHPTPAQSAFADCLRDAAQDAAKEISASLAL